MFISLERRRLPAWSFVRLRALRQVEYADFGGICHFHVSICSLPWIWFQKCCNWRRVAVLMHLCTERAKQCGSIGSFDHISSGGWC